MYVVLTAQRRTAPVMAGQQLWNAAYDGRVDEVRRLLDQGVPPDEYRDDLVSAAPPPGAVPRALLCGVVG